MPTPPPIKVRKTTPLSVLGVNLTDKLAKSKVAMADGADRVELLFERFSQHVALHLDFLDSAELERLSDKVNGAFEAVLRKRAELCTRSLAVSEGLTIFERPDRHHKRRRVQVFDNSGNNFQSASVQQGDLKTEPEFETALDHVNNGNRDSSFPEAGMTSMNAESHRDSSEGSLLNGDHLPAFPPQPVTTARAPSTTNDASSIAMEANTPISDSIDETRIPPLVAGNVVAWLEEHAPTIVLDPTQPRSYVELRCSICNANCVYKGTLMKGINGMRMHLASPMHADDFERGQIWSGRAVGEETRYRNSSADEVKAMATGGSGAYTVEHIRAPRKMSRSHSSTSTCTALRRTEA